MEICINESGKTVEIWLSNADKQDAALHKQLQPLYKKYKDTKYLVAVFQSGGRDLYDATADLLCYNRKRLAQLEVLKGRQQGIITER